MNVKVTKDNVSILNKDELKVHVGEYKVNLINFDFSEEYTKDLVLNALFVMNDGSSFQTSILDDECHIPGQVLESKGHVLLGVYAYKVNEDELELRYSPHPDYFNVELGSYDPTAEESQEITPTQFEQYMQALNDGLNQVKDSISELDNATKNANDLVDEINKKLENGEFIGPQGPQGIQGEPGKDGTNGIDGVGITTITSGQATEENGNTITPITVEKTDGSSETFNVSAKNGIDGKNGQNGKDGINGTNGIDGQDGITPNIQIGTVETLEPTEEATVTRTGTDEEPVFNFGIPKGEKGEPGEITEDTLDNVIPKQTATDSIININDALNYKVFNFNVDGAYEQNGEPTPETPIPITTLSFDEIMNCGQNLFDLDDVKQVANNEKITTNVDDDGFIHVDIDNTGYSSEVFANYWTNISKNLITNHDYLGIIEVKEYSGSGYNCFVGTENVSQFKTGIIYYNQKPGIFIKKITTKDSFTDTYTMLRSFIQCPANSKVSITYRISILADLTVNQENFVYKPYKATDYSIDLQANEMVSLPNGIKDELTIDKEGNVNLIKNVGKKILNGSEEWMPNTNYTTSSMLAVQYLENNMLSNSIIISDHFTYNAVTDIDTIRAATQYVLIGLDITEFATVGDFKNWLQSNNTTIYYQLAESQTINLGKLEDLITTEQGSNTFAINGNIDTNISTTYALDLKKYIDNKIATVSSAVVEME